MRRSVFATGLTLAAAAVVVGGVVVAVWGSSVGVGLIIAGLPGVVLTGLFTAVDTHSTPTPSAPRRRTRPRAQPRRR